MTVLNLLPDEALWRARPVKYYSGDWDAVLDIIPKFEIEPYCAGPDEPENPYLRSVVRLPRSAVERRMPVGVVSPSYALALHDEVAKLCRNTLLDAGIKANELRYEIGLSELGEWMNLQIYFPERFGLVDTHGKKLDLRMECFNSVDGSSRLVILLGWFRFVCANGLVIGETKIEIKERHGQKLDLQAIAERIRPALRAVNEDRERMKAWEGEAIAIHDVERWADNDLSEKWGKKAAARVFHICDSGRDVEISEPFAKGEATEKPIRYLDPVPGQPEHARTKYDVVQAMSFVASRRNNAEERTEWQGAINTLIGSLKTSAA